MTIRLLPSIDELEKTFEYNPDTGELKRKLFRGKPCDPYLVGTPDETGHLHVFACFAMFPVTRVAWKMYYKEEPPEVIDHYPDTTTDNNRITNLRKSNYSHNTAIGKVNSVNKTGVKGLTVSSRTKDKQYIASLRVKDKRWKLYFPYTDEGKQMAVDWLNDMRKIIHNVEDK